MTEIHQRLNFARQMAEDSARLILSHYQQTGLQVDSKSDESPVTIADRGAEQLMRNAIAKTFPDDGVLGEEFDDVPAQNRFRWILDPIDGTKAFIHGVPLFGTLIGVEFAGRMIAGVCGFPALNEVVFAADGYGTWWKVGDREPVRTFVSHESDLSKARLMFTEPTSWPAIGRTAVMNEVIGRVKIARGWGDCYGHAMVATGRAELCVDPVMSAWDIAALIPILREAGGSCTDWNGVETVTGGDGVSVNSALRQVSLELLRPAAR